MPCRITSWQPIKSGPWCPFPNNPLFCRDYLLWQQQQLTMMMMMRECNSDNIPRVSSQIPADPITRDDAFTKKREIWRPISYKDNTVRLTKRTTDVRNQTIDLCGWGSDFLSSIILLLHVWPVTGTHGNANLFYTNTTFFAVLCAFLNSTNIRDNRLLQHPYRFFHRGFVPCFISSLSVSWSEVFGR